MRAVFTCSIDDGHPSDMKMAELLDKHGLNGTFFIPIKNREGLPVLSPAQMRQIGGRFEIGSHTHDHCYLNTVALSEAGYQITQGKKKLEDILGKEVAGFCYPGGKYRQEHIDILRCTGFRYARTTMNLCFDSGDHPFEMPTTCQFYPHPRAVYLRNFVKAGNWSKRRDGLQLALQHRHWLDRLYALFDYSFRQQGVFHLWLHSHDIEQLDAWRALDDFLAGVASRIAVPERLSNQQLISRQLLS